MKRFITAFCIVACIGLIAHTWAQGKVGGADENASADYFKAQGDVMECAPPKFLLISEVDLDAQTLTGLSTIETLRPESVVIAFHQTFRLSDVKVTNARRKAIADDDLKDLKGKLVVLSDGKGPLTAAYLGLFREDTIVVSISPATK